MNTITKRVFVQKRNSNMEFSPYNRDADRADFTVGLGGLRIEDGMPRAELIRQLRDTLAKLEAVGDVDVFVVQ